MCTSQGIMVVQQLLLPPIFIRNYGMSDYGQWLTLSATVAYLSTLNFGVNTFVNNELAMRYSRGEMRSYHTYQSTALRMLLAIAVFAVLVLSMVFILPVDQWLHLTFAHRASALILFGLGLQIALNIPLNFFTGSYLVFGCASRGTNWQNAQRFGVVIVSAIAGMFSTQLEIIAVLQVGVVLGTAVCVMWDLQRAKPELFPTIRFWDWRMARAIAKPSSHFALIFSTVFLAFQLPVLLLQVLAGPVAVVEFTVMRTMFSMVRQGLACFTIALGPEVTRAFGRQDWPVLSRLYLTSERLLFAFIPAGNLGVLLAAPILLTIWLHKPGLYSVGTYTLMAVTSCVMCAKEHKHQFQFATNRHEEMARFLFGSYLVMVLVSYFAITHFGITGLLVCWLTAEVIQTLRIVKLNHQLLSQAVEFSWSPLLRLALLIIVGTLGVVVAVEGLLFASRASQIIAGFGTILGLLFAAAWAFRVDRIVLALYSGRFGARAPATT